MTFRRRGRRSTALPSEPSQAVENVPDSTSEDAPAARISMRRRLPRLPRVRVNWSLLFLIGALVALTIFALLLNQGALPRQVITWWPLVIAIFAALWLIASLLRRDTAALLGSTALFGVSISLILASAYGVPLGATLVGVAMISIGLGIVVRGLLWSSRPA